MNGFVDFIPVNDGPERIFSYFIQSNFFIFKRILDPYHIHTTIRREQGHDIDAACGQLRSE